ncbi:MAG: homoserine O-acetyltransferase [Candidatus Firestonebacteria bacterium]|nr:homoserine O-acetyltransferase [Candidatus Firestonebacteria bacterium]
MPDVKTNNPAADSVGIVVTRTLTVAQPPDVLKLECGRSLGPITVAYETYGQLTPERDNAILILHAWTGDAHAAGRHHPDDPKPGWWDNMVGPGKAFDTNRYFIICTNVLGGCKGSTGPTSPDPATGKPYGLTFPILTIADMVKVQKLVLDALGIERLLSMVGGSMGGMQALEWLLRYPEVPRSAIILASTSRLSPQSIAFNEVGRHAIVSDPNWQNGAYYGTDRQPETGLAIARMIGHITFLSDESMNQKFGRRLQNRNEYGYELTREFEVESYLHAQGSRFVKRFDANTYLYLTKAMDYYDAAQDWGEGSLEKACRRVEAKTLVVSFSSDWLFPSYQSRELVKALRQNNKDVSYLEIESSYGHDAFLLESSTLQRVMESFLDNLYATVVKHDA